MSYSPGGGSGSVNGSTDVATSNLQNGQLLTWNSSAGKWVNLLPGAGITINKQTGTNYTVGLSDSGTEIEMNNSAANTLYIPAQTAVAWPTGANFNVRQMGAGLTTIAIVSNSGVTLLTPNGANIANQYMTATVIRSSQDTWIVDGGVST